MAYSINGLYGAYSASERVKRFSLGDRYARSENHVWAIRSASQIQGC